jgi:hypothetical protein
MGQCTAIGRVDALPHLFHSGMTKLGRHDHPDGSRADPDDQHYL